MANRIKFIANAYGLSKSGPSVPEPTQKHIPEWYRKADRYYKQPDGEPYRQQDGSMMLTWKSCPALFDVLATGYVFRTPCDVEFYKNDNSKISVKVSDPKMQHFCSERPPMPEFMNPLGYYEDHFAWWPDWAVELPKGYSGLYTNPLMRYDLPFHTPPGIVDNDKVNLSGLVPFFIAKGFEGIIPAGTPYLQLIPFKREDWQSELIIESDSTIYQKNTDNSKKYRLPDGGVYKNTVWEKREYI